MLLEMSVFWTFSMETSGPRRVAVSPNLFDVMAA